mmetsp:Transcript_519/g.963  ORF Transcript_519/g.963 Transcript_519/m.963 type:complete len:134 (-) Transcript_519:35-436(-)
MQEKVWSCLAAKTVEGTSLALERVYDVHSSYSLPAGMLSVGHSVADDVLKEDLEHTTGLLVDEAGDTLDTTTASQTANRGLCDTLDVIAQYLAMTLGATLAKSLASLSASRHSDYLVCLLNVLVASCFELLLC